MSGSVSSFSLSKRFQKTVDELDGMVSLFIFWDSNMEVSDIAKEKTSNCLCVESSKKSGVKKMSRKLTLGLMVAAWGLYVISLLLPSARIDRDHGYALGLGIIRFIFNPFSWLFILPFVYFLVNFTFLVSPFYMSRRLRGQAHEFYKSLIVFSVICTWVAPVFCDGIAVGYFLWMLSFQVAALAFLLPQKQP